MLLTITDAEPTARRDKRDQPAGLMDSRMGFWVLVATIIGSSMVFIDGTVVNVALPVLQAELGATVADVQWVVESYALLLSALILVGGSLGDHFGRRRMYVVGVVIFAVASVACGLAPDAHTLILARAAQGVGGALLTPGSLAIISATFEGARRGQAIGTWSGFSAITTAVGPVLGGWLVENVSWRWVFFINVPLAIVVLFVTLWRVPESRDPHAARLDGWGAVLATLGLGSLVFGLIESSNLGVGHPVVLATVVGGFLLLGAFLLVEARISSPMMPLTLFRSRRFAGANLLTFLLYGGMSGAFFFLPFNLIQVQGYSPTAAGAALLPFVVVMFLLSRWSGGLIARVGPRVPLVVGPFLAGIAILLYGVASGGGSYWTTFFPAVTLHGLGMALTIAPLSTVVMGAVDVSHAGLASGVNNAVARTGGLLAIAVLGIVMLVAFNGQLDAALATIPLSDAARAALDAQRIRLAAAEVPLGLDPSVALALRRALDDAFVAGYRVVIAITGGLAIAGSLVALVFIDSRKA